jgi:hypothetical protein
MSPYFLHNIQFYNKPQNDIVILTSSSFINCRYHWIPLLAVQFFEVAQELHFL